MSKITFYSLKKSNCDYICSHKMSAPLDKTAFELRSEGLLRMCVNKMYSKTITRLEAQVQLVYRHIKVHLHLSCSEYLTLLNLSIKLNSPKRCRFQFIIHENGLAHRKKYRIPAGCVPPAFVVRGGGGRFYRTLRVLNLISRKRSHTSEILHYLLFTIGYS